MEIQDSLAGRMILVVEDEYFVAQTIVDMLEEAGATVVGPIGWADEALSVIADPTTAIDGAVLDLNLHGKKSYPIADALTARNVHFVFATGYGSGTIDQAYETYPRCQKPFHYSDLLTALAAR